LATLIAEPGDTLVTYGGTGYQVPFSNRMDDCCAAGKPNERELHNGQSSTSLNREGQFAAVEHASVRAGSFETRQSSLEQSSARASQRSGPAVGVRSRYAHAGMISLTPAPESAINK